MCHLSLNWIDDPASCWLAAAAAATVRHALLGVPGPAPGCPPRPGASPAALELCCSSAGSATAGQPWGNSVILTRPRSNPGAACQQCSKAEACRRPATACSDEGCAAPGAATAPAGPWACRRCAERTQLMLSGLCSAHRGLTTRRPLVCVCVAWHVVHGQQQGVWRSSAGRAAAAGGRTPGAACPVLTALPQRHRSRAVRGLRVSCGSLVSSTQARLARGGVTGGVTAGHPRARAGGCGALWRRLAPSPMGVAMRRPRRGGVPAGVPPKAAHVNDHQAGSRLFMRRLSSARAARRLAGRRRPLWAACRLRASFVGLRAFSAIMRRRAGDSGARIHV